MRAYCRGASSESNRPEDPRVDPAPRQPRGGPNLVRGMGAMRDTFDGLGLPYRIFGFDSDMSEVISYAQAADGWMKSGGREEVAAKLNLSGSTA